MSDQESMILQMKEMALFENKLSEACFERCIYNFNIYGLDKREVQCVDNCFNKHSQGNVRIAERFAEIGLQYQQKLLEDQQKLAADQKEAWEKAAQFAQASGLTTPVPSTPLTGAQTGAPTGAQTTPQTQPSQLSQTFTPIHPGVKQK